MSNIRQCAVAGMFYPANAAELSAAVDSYLANSDSTDIHPKAIIAPHAGYVYSGQVAAHAYKALALKKDKIKRIVLLGPSHRVPFHGCALSNANFFETPLGDIPVDQDANAKLIKSGLAKNMDAAHALEHSLEVHLPFLQRALNDFRLVPIVVGDANAEEVSNIIEFFWNDEETYFVISSDLSHFHSYAEAKQLDATTSQAIVDFNIDQISSEQACGCRPVIGLLNSAKKHHLSACILDLKNSGDTGGDKDRVVGYGAYAFY